MNNFSTLECFRAHNPLLKDVQHWRGLGGVRVWVGSVEARSDGVLVHGTAQAWTSLGDGS